MSRAKKIVVDIISVALVLAVFYFLGREVTENWEHIRAFDFQFNFPMLLLSSAVYAGTFLVLGVGWWFILRYLCCNVPFIETILYFFITQPAKYVPGKIWISVARMKFCAPHGVSNSVTLLTTGTEAALEIFAGSYISLVALLNIDWFGKFSVYGIIAISAAGLILLIPKVFYFFINLYLRIAKKPPLAPEHRVTFSELFLLQCIYLIAMLGLGVSHVLFLLSFTPVAPEYLPFLISIGAMSYVVSIIAIFTPSGLGVREGIWYIALKSIVGTSPALVYAFISRIWNIALEAIFVFIALPLLWFRRKFRAPALPGALEK